MMEAQTRLATVKLIKFTLRELKLKKLIKLKNQGIAQAVYDGLSKAEGDLVSWLPSDGAYDVKSLGKFYDSCISEDQDLFIGYRSNKKKDFLLVFFCQNF